VVSIVDADMVLRSDFYQRTLPYLQTERDAMVLAPQVRPARPHRPRPCAAPACACVVSVGTSRAASRGCASVQRCSKQSV